MTSYFILKLFKRAALFYYANELDAQPEIKEFLMDKANRSRYVFHPSKEDLDNNSTKNYEKKWESENHIAESIYASKHNTSYAPLKISYYNQCLFDSVKNSIQEKIENSGYLLVNYFRSDILGYDKSCKKYFPLWIENCSHGCNKSINFLTPYTLQITYPETQNQKIIIDLKRMQYKIIVK